MSWGTKQARASSRANHVFINLCSSANRTTVSWGILTDYTKSWATMLALLLVTGTGLGKSLEGDQMKSLQAGTRQGSASQAGTKLGQVPEENTAISPRIKEVTKLK